MEAEYTIQNEYLDTHVLHFKPISSRAFARIQHAHAWLQQKAPETRWQGRAVKVLAKTMAVTGCVGTIPVALVEFIAVGIIGTLGIVLHTATGAHSRFLEKYSAKALAYSINSLATFIFEIIALTSFSNETVSKWLYPKYHTVASVTDQISHLGTAALVQAFCAWCFYHSRNRGTDAGIVRPVNVLLEGAPDAIMDVVDSMILDFAPPEHRDVSLRDFFNRLTPERQEILRNLNIRRMLNNHYMQQFIPIIQQYMQAANLADNNPNVERRENEVVFNRYSNAEKTYQNYLKDCVKEAIKTMVDKDWVKHLDPNNDEKAGKDLLEMFDAGATQPVAHITQFIEIEKGNQCPNAFQHRDLQQYNQRHDRIEKAGEHLQNFSENDKNLLIERLIKGNDFNLGVRTLDDKDAVDVLYREITSLASELHQGKLMSVLIFNLQDRDFTSENLFGKAWGEAINEI